jgi:hypothetical protein
MVVGVIVVWFAEQVLAMGKTCIYPCWQKGSMSCIKYHHIIMKLPGESKQDFVTASWALMESLKEELVTSAAFLFGQCGVSMQYMWTFIFFWIARANL